jgi:phage tail sheath protein FI
MPVQPTYPGVYIEEVPSGVRPILGVATSITAFIGRAAKGPLDTPVVCNSWGDFERSFGGLFANGALGYAVRDFFLNGGAQAVVVRLYRGTSNTTAKLVVRAAADANRITLAAASPGAWGNTLRARVDHNVSAEAAASLGLAASDLFNLSVQDTATGTTEIFRNLTVADHPRRIDRVLVNQSVLVRTDGALPAARPDPHAAPDAGRTIWQDNAAAPHPSSKVEVADRGVDGDALNADSFLGVPADAFETNKRGLYALEKVDLFNLLVIPPYTGGGTPDEIDATVLTAAVAYAEKRRAFVIVDSPAAWTMKAQAVSGIGGLNLTSKNAALFFPRIVAPDPLRNNAPRTMPACGAVAGIFARTDAERGVWKAPAGLAATIRGPQALSVPLTDAENGELNPLGVNCLRALPAAGMVVWGSRTRQGDDRLASEWKYVPVRRLALFLEETLFRGLQWVVFEPNDEPLWSQIRLNVGAFMQGLFRQGAFAGRTPQEAYLVKCDAETTTQADVNAGIVNILVGFAPLKPAEFVIVRIQQLAGQSQA